jgi:hypothetical protein
MLDAKQAWLIHLVMFGFRPSSAILNVFVAAEAVQEFLPEGELPLGDHPRVFGPPEFGLEFWAAKFRRAVILPFFPPSLEHNGIFSA